jgi:hypothetical protein
VDAEQLDPPLKHIFLLLISDLLRDYSLQEPQDLRVRRRRVPLPEKPLLDALREQVELFTSRLESAQMTLDVNGLGNARAINADINQVSSVGDVAGEAEITAVVTSPPYAMALPYIDTQRISLIWLGLCEPAELRPLEAALTGSREIGTRDRRLQNDRLSANDGRLPKAEHEVCLQMLDSLGPSDGFRRQSVPALLYRYFEQSAAMFKAVRNLVTEEVPYALVVGHNKTTLGGREFQIDTPAHLASLAQANGWGCEEILGLQTYKRFGLHAQNAVTAESLVWLRSK